MKSKSWIKRIISVIVSLMMGFFHYSPAEASIGLSTRFVDVTLEFLEVGQSYNLRKLRNIPYTIRNKGTADTDVEVVILLPKKEHLAPGYEAIPDPTWIQLIPNKFKLPAGQTGYAEMVIQIPNDPAYIGKHYQATVWAKTVGAGIFAAGTQSRLRFSVGPGPETLKDEAKAKAMMTLDFDVTPSEIYVTDLEPGKTYDLNKLANKKLKITNRAETPINMRFNSVGWGTDMTLSGDYVPAPDPSWLKFSPEKMKVKPQKIVTVKPIITIPGGDEHRGKKYAFLLKADLVMGVELEVYSKIYVSIKK